MLHMDTNEQNIIARELYRKLGYLEAGIVPCEFSAVREKTIRKKVMYMDAFEEGDK